jgi:3-methyl-2-oxobutanoate hydroxymethyltransferase
MSTSVARPKRVTVPQIVARKGGEPVTVLTCYTAPMAGFLDAHVDILLVGDSLGMVVYGFDSTLRVTLDMMIAHGAAVVRGSSRALVVVDMPFASFQESPAQAYRNAARIMAETGAAAIKLEGGVEMAETIAFLVARGIPVMGHIGLLPQSFNAQGGYRIQGRDARGASQVLRDARAVAEAGAFSLVIEGTTEQTARDATTAVLVPTIGIGASPACDGQVLVTEDMLGLFAAFKPSFVKRYAELGREVEAAAAAYARDVKARRFPGPEHVFSAPQTVKP